MIYTIMRRYGMIWIVLASAIGTAAALVVSALLHRKLCQRRTAAALRIRCDHGVAEERFVRIGGIDQWIGIRGEDRDNPVLLVIHGGPGAPCSIFTPVIRSWERHFTVVQWDQGGAGELTLERLIRDGIEVAEFVHGHLTRRKSSCWAVPLAT